MFELGDRRLGFVAGFECADCNPPAASLRKHQILSLKRHFEQADRRRENAKSGPQAKIRWGTARFPGRVDMTATLAGAGALACPGALCRLGPGLGLGISCNILTPGTRWVGIKTTGIRRP
jgi:hypothetical protein